MTGTTTRNNADFVGHRQSCVSRIWQGGRLARALAVCVMCTVLAPAQAQQPSSVLLMGAGDSIGEGVQAGDAAWQTQVFSYLSWIGYQMNVPFDLPLIQTNFFGQVGNLNERSRLYPSVVANNVAVSGADVNSLLNEVAGGAFDSETDLVLLPRAQSQMQAIESAAPEMVVCWIGNNDALSAAISFSAMNASQLTPVAQFDASFVEIADRFAALNTAHGTRVVFANLPDVTRIGFLVDRATAEYFLGFPVNLPANSFTSVIGMVLMKVAGNDELIDNPDYVLDPTEIAAIQARIQAFNSIIQREANRIGMPVVDIHTAFEELALNPQLFYGWPVRPAFMGGLFSLDGVHPSNLGHALIANEFIRTMNGAFALGIPEISQPVLNYLFLTDPHIDKDLDRSATGRPGVGLLESLALLFGFTGDSNDFNASAQ